MLELHVEEIKTKTEISVFSLTCPLQDGFDEKKKKKKNKREKAGKIQEVHQSEILQLFWTFVQFNFSLPSKIESTFKAV